ncbi:hypothetical protein [Kitasatospora griseola]|uniref:hypothetical protein n=1 Tax=Kitasatospora griseola TaxID=2064 RepID=UPI000B0EA6F1|nr:hypothetical protein [Kitasatospora griseola]
MHTDAKPVNTGTPEPPAKKVIGGITLYGPQLLKLTRAAMGTSRSAVLRQLIDRHL